MKTQRSLLLLLGGMVLILLVQGIILPLLSYRSESAARLDRARARHTELAPLAAAIASQPLPTTTQTTLFSIINREAERLGLSRRIEALRPAAVEEGQGAERIDLRLSAIYLDQCINWLYALESYPDIRVETLSLKRTEQRLLDLDMAIVRKGESRR